MSGNLLGSKNLRKIESMLGRKVSHAWTGEHCWATVYFVDGGSVYFNYKENRVAHPLRNTQAGHDAVQRAFDVAWKAGKSIDEAKAISDAVHREIYS